MKNPILIIALGIALLLVVQIDAQVFDIPSDVYTELTKKEKKQWKKTARQYKRNPHNLKILEGEHAFYMEEANRLQPMVAEKDQRIHVLEMDLSALNEHLYQMENNALHQGGEVEKGVFFKLQIGSFAKVKLPEDLAEAKNVATEDDPKGQKILLGKFRDYEKVKKFQGYMKEMGIKDAWIVSYQDGKRVPIEQVLRINP